MKRVKKILFLLSPAFPKTFPTIIEEYCDVKILGLIRDFKGKSLPTNVLINEILNGIDLEELFKIKIPKLST